RAITRTGGLVKLRYYGANEPPPRRDLAPSSKRPSEIASRLPTIRTGIHSRYGPIDPSASRRPLRGGRRREPSGIAMRLLANGYHQTVGIKVLGDAHAKHLHWGLDARHVPLQHFLVEFIKIRDIQTGTASSSIS